MLYIILPALIIIVAIIYWRIIHIKRVSQTICCPEGQFSVLGGKIDLLLLWKMEKLFL